MKKYSCLCLLLAVLLCLASCGQNEKAAAPSGESTGETVDYVSLSRFGQDSGYVAQGYVVQGLYGSLCNLSFSTDTVCNCKPEYTLVFGNETIYYVKHGGEEILRYNEDGLAEQAQSSEGVLSALHTILPSFFPEYTFN